MSHHEFTIGYPNRQEAIVTSCRIAHPYNPSINPYDGNALWDTGAMCTVINKKLSKYLNLIPTGKINARGVHSMEEVNKYLINIELNDEIVVNKLGVLEANLGDNLDVLVGMDIIGRGDFLICHGKIFSFGVPSLKALIDIIRKS